MRVWVRMLCVVGVALLVVGCGAPTASSGGEPFGFVETIPVRAVEPEKPRRIELLRAEFARRMSQVQPGMSETAVVQLLGAADQVRSAETLRHIRPDGTDHVLCYGVPSGGGLPTLGQVYIDRAGLVQYAFGGGEAIDSSIVDEPALREVLQQIHELPPLQGLHYDPLAVIRAANALQPLGKDAALSVIEEYLRVTPHWPVGPRQGVFALLRVLFEMPEGVPMPEVRLGQPSPPKPVNVAAAPRFPVLIIGDVPLLLISGFDRGGFTEPVESHVAFFRQHGTMRPRKLSPTDNPMLLVDQVLAEQGEIFEHPNQSWDRERAKAMLANQVLYLVDDVYHVPTVRGVKFDWCCNNADPLWQHHMDTAAQRPFRWDAGRQSYTYGGRS